MARKLSLNIAENYVAPKWDPDKALTEALSEKNQFLQNNPQLRLFQKEIDTMLDKAGSSQNRMAVLAMLIEGKLIELNQKLKKLNILLLEAAES